MAVTANCAECGRVAQVNLTSDGPSLCLVCADLTDLAGEPDTGDGMGAEYEYGADHADPDGVEDDDAYATLGWTEQDFRDEEMGRMP